MMYIKSTVGAVATLLVLAACGAGDEGADVVPDDPTSPATTSAPATPEPESPSPESPASESPAPDSPAPASPSPPATGSEGGSGVLTLAESCRAVLDDQQAAVTALQTYARNPINADVADLDRLRSELKTGAVSAPEPLRQELSTQVGVLNSVVEGIQQGNPQRVNVNDFEAAKERITTLCEEAR